MNFKANSLIKRVLTFVLAFAMVATSVYVTPVALAVEGDEDVIIEETGVVEEAAGEVEETVSDEIDALPADGAMLTAGNLVFATGTELGGAYDPDSTKVTLDAIQTAFRTDGATGDTSLKNNTTVVKVDELTDAKIKEAFKSAAKSGSEYTAYTVSVEKGSATATADAFASNNPRTFVTDQLTSGITAVGVYKLEMVFKTAEVTVDGGTVTVAPASDVLKTFTQTFEITKAKNDYTVYVDDATEAVAPGGDGTIIVEDTTLYELDANGKQVDQAAGKNTVKLMIKNSAGNAKINLADVGATIKEIKNTSDESGFFSGTDKKPSATISTSEDGVIDIAWGALKNVEDGVDTFIQTSGTATITVSFTNSEDMVIQLSAKASDPRVIVKYTLEGVGTNNTAKYSVNSLVDTGALKALVTASACAPGVRDNSSLLAKGVAASSVGDLDGKAHWAGELVDGVPYAPKAGDYIFDLSVKKDTAAAEATDPSYTQTVDPTNGLDVGKYKVSYSVVKYVEGTKPAGWKEGNDEPAPVAVNVLIDGETETTKPYENEFEITEGAVTELKLNNVTAGAAVSPSTKGTATVTDIVPAASANQAATKNALEIIATATKTSGGQVVPQAITKATLAELDEDAKKFFVTGATAAATGGVANVKYGMLKYDAEAKPPVASGSLKVDVETVNYGTVTVTVTITADTSFVDKKSSLKWGGDLGDLFNETAADAYAEIEYSGTAKSLKVVNSDGTDISSDKWTATTAVTYKKKNGGTWADQTTVPTAVGEYKVTAKYKEVLESGSEATPKEEELTQLFKIVKATGYAITDGKTLETIDQSVVMASGSEWNTTPLTDTIKTAIKDHLDTADVISYTDEKGVSAKGKFKVIAAGNFTAKGYISDGKETGKTVEPVKYNDVEITNIVDLTGKGLTTHYKGQPYIVIETDGDSANVVAGTRAVLLVNVEMPAAKTQDETTTDTTLSSGTHKVTFVVYEDGVRREYYVATVKHGKTVSAPTYTDADDTGATVNTWYYGNAVWDFDNGIVNSNITLYGYVETLKSDSGFRVYTIPDQTYTGAAIKPVVTVVDGDGKVLAKSKYSVKYDKAINVGTYNVTVTIKADRKNKIQKTPLAPMSFNVVKADIGNATFAGKDVFGTLKVTRGTEAANVSVSVPKALKYGKKTLKLGTDFTYEVRNDVGGTLAASGTKSSETKATLAKGEYYMVFKGIGTNFGGAKETGSVIYVSSAAQQLKNAKIVLGKKNTTYKPGDQENNGPSTVTVTINKVPYTWTAQYNATTKAYDGGKWEWTKTDAEKKYETDNGAPLNDPGFNVVVTSSDDYVPNNIGNVGIYLVPTGNGPTTYYGYKSTSYAIKADPALKLKGNAGSGLKKALSAAKITYTGRGVTLEDAANATLTAEDKAASKTPADVINAALGIDMTATGAVSYTGLYNITYSKNIKPGTATATFTPANTAATGVTGSFKVTYKIKPAVITDTTNLITLNAAIEDKKAADGTTHDHYELIAAEGATSYLDSANTKKFVLTAAALEKVTLTNKISGKKLVEGVDYKISYKDNGVKVKKDAKLIITGAGNYKGAKLEIVIHKYVAPTPTTPDTSGSK